MKYCRGQGVDLGCGQVRIRPDTIGIDLYHPSADMKADARKLEEFPDSHFDYVFSSHLLEEIQNTEATLREWLRILRPGGHIVLYQADKELYLPFDHPMCNKNHKHHFSWEELWAIFEKIGGVELIHHGRYPESDEWSFEIVVRKGGAMKEESEAGQGISILVPTLNRPQSIEDLAKSVEKTTSHPENVEIIFGIQDDPPSRDKVRELAPSMKVRLRAEDIKKYHDGQAHLDFLWNQIYELAEYPILGFFGDDVLFKTPGWDVEVRKEFDKDQNILFACNDMHIQKGGTATLFFTHRIFHERVGFYLKPEFRRWYMDTYWGNCFKGAGRYVYREDVVTEHLSPDVFKDRADDVYRDMEHFKNEDRKLWRSEAMQKEVAEMSQTIKAMKKKVISFSLWGTNPKYLIGAEENVKLQKKHFPGWVCRFYVDGTVPDETISRLRSLGAEIVKKDICDEFQGLFWRFEAAWDPDIERYIIRDCDSRLNEREGAAVREWEASDKSFHTMRDHPNHDIQVLGAMWGAKGMHPKGFKEDFEKFMKSINEMATLKPQRGRFFYSDQKLLNDVVWPKVKADAMVHDDGTRFGKMTPFKIKLPEGQFIGQQWGADNKPIEVPM